MSEKVSKSKRPRFMNRRPDQPEKLTSKTSALFGFFLIAVGLAAGYWLGLNWYYLGVVLVFSGITFVTESINSPAHNRWRDWAMLLLGLPIALVGAALTLLTLDSVSVALNLLFWTLCPFGVWVFFTGWLYSHRRRKHNA